MPSRALAVAAPLSLVFVLAAGLPGQGPTAGLRIEDLSVQPAPLDDGREVTVSFRVVNGGPKAVGPLVLEIAAGAGGTESGVEVEAIGPGKAAYVSRAFALPDGLEEIDVKVHVSQGGLLLAKATLPFLAVPPAPGKWVSIGPRRITAPPVPSLGLGAYDATGRLTAIAVHPSNPNVIYVGSPGELGHEGSGIWKTTNGGVSWKDITGDLPLAIAAIAIDPTAPERVYVVTADDGVFRSDNGGTVWNHVYTKKLDVVRNTADGDRTVLLVDPVDPDVLFLTTGSGVRRSPDGGASWPRSLQGHATSVVMDPLNHEVLYAALQGGGIYRTSTGGLPLGPDGWTLETDWPMDNPPDAAAYSPQFGILLAMSHPSASAPSVLYALLGPVNPSYFGRTLYRKVGEGPWERRNRCESIVLRGMCVANLMAVEPGNPDQLYLGGQLLRVSSNGGSHFTVVPTSGREDRQPDAPHGDYHGWAIDPLSPQVVFAATDGGIYQSSDRGKQGTWSFIGEGIVNAEIYDLAGGAVAPRWIFAGTQDNGTMLYNGSKTWEHVFPAQPTDWAVCAGCGGDGALVAVDPTDPKTFYLMFQLQDSLTKTANAEKGPFEPFNQGLTGFSNPCGAFNAGFHFQVHPTKPTTLLASCHNLYQTTTNVPPGDWKKILPPWSTSPPVGRIVRSAIDGDGDIYYAGTNDGRVHAGKGGINFVEVFQHPDGRHVMDMDVNPLDPATVYLAFSRPYVVGRQCDDLGARRIYRLRRGSNYWSVTATDITGVAGAGGLPEGLCVNALAVDPRPPLTVYAATNRGVYRGRPPAGPVMSKVGPTSPWTWTAFNDGMPLADVRDLELHPRAQLMFAATFGRGAYEVFLGGARQAPKLAPKALPPVDIIPK